MSAIFSCREASRLASESLDQSLGVRKSMSLYMHTMMCSACKAYVRQIRFIDRVFRLHAQRVEPTIPTSESLDQAARERIRAKLKQGG